MTPSNGPLWGAIIVVALVIGGCSQPKPVEVAVPNFVKKTILRAENEADALGLQLEKSGLSSNSCLDGADCTIYRMDPKPGTLVQRGAEIEVEFLTKDEAAFYAKYRTMPKLVGRSEKQAQSLLDPVGSTVDMDMKETRSIPEGRTRVISQSPKPGKPLRIGQEILLVVGRNSDASSSTGNPDTDIDLGDRGESRFCSRRKWC